jgi:secreted trypsin-like serine protease
MLFQIVGLGTIGTSKNNTVIMPNELQRADMPVLSYKKCIQTGNSNTFRNYLVPGENFCAGYQNGTTACRGDSGSGFAINVDGRWFVRGVLSFGVADSYRCFSNYNVFLDIVKYIPWIMENMQRRG